MSILVTLQLPVRTHGGSAWVYRREVELPCLVIGMGLAGWGLPRLMGAGVDVCTRVAEITAHESGKIYVTACGSEELSYTKEQVLSTLGPGWHMVTTAIPLPELDDDLQDLP